MIKHREGPYLVRNRLFDRKVARMEMARARSKTTLKNNMKLFVFNNQPHGYPKEYTYQSNNFQIKFTRQLFKCCTSSTQQLRLDFITIKVSFSNHPQNAQRQKSKSHAMLCNQFLSSFIVGAIYHQLPQPAVWIEYFKYDVYQWMILL